MFHRVLFCTKFKIGLRSPALDVRNYCTMIDNKNKKLTTGPEKQQLFVDKLSIRGEQKPFMNYFEKQRTKRLHCALICNRSRTPIQQSFYAGQLGLHNACVLDI